MPKKICFYDFGLHSYNEDLSKKWFVYYYEPQKPNYRVRVYGKINSFTDAPARHQEAARLIHALTQKFLPPQPQTTQKNIDNYITEYLTIKTNTVKDASLKSLKAIYSNYTYYLHQNKLTLHPTQIPYDHARQYTQTVLSPKHKTTQNKYRGGLKMFWDWLILERAATENPFTATKRNKRQSTPYLHYQPHQIRTLKAHITQHDPQMWLAIGFICYAFIRPKELRFLKVGDIFLEENKILVRADVSKNGKQQFVPIAPPLRTAIINAGIMAHGNDCFVLGIKQHPDTKQVGINYLKLRHQKHLKACYIDTQYYKLYSWKHTGALRNVKSGMNMRELQLMMRHHSLEETQHYLESLGYNTTAEVAKTPEL